MLGEKKKHAAPKETHLALVPSTVLAFLGRTVFE